MKKELTIYLPGNSLLLLTDKSALDKDRILEFRFNNEFRFKYPVKVTFEIDQKIELTESQLENLIYEFKNSAKFVQSNISFEEFLRDKLFSGETK